MQVNRNVKILVAVAATAVLLTFSEMNAATLFAAIVGAVLIILGLVSYYRPASVVGLMVTGASVAISNDPGSLTAMPSLLNAGLGILIPVYLLAWVSLSSGFDVPAESRLKTRASALTILFMLTCALSVPVAALALSYFSPRFSMSMSVLTEIAIILGVTTTGIIILTTQSPKSTAGVMPSREEVSVGEDTGGKQ